MPAEAHRYDVTRYFALAECGIISPDDRIELLDGLIVAMSPQTPSHAAAVHRVEHALLRKLGYDTVVRVQASFIAGDQSVPEPDIALVPGRPEDYYSQHPTRAHLIVEVALSSLVQDRLTKASIYARAGVPCYWLVNLRDRCVEAYRDPDREAGHYRTVQRVTGSDELTIDAFPDVRFAADELLLPAC